MLFNLAALKDMSISQSKEYVKQFFIPLDNGNHVFLNNGVYEIREDTEIKKTYFNRINKDITNWYFKEYTDIRTVCYSFNKDTLFDNYINLCPKKLNIYDPLYIVDETNDDLNVIKNYILEVLCSNKIESYNYIMQWLCKCFNGLKNNSCLYLKGPQGSGKSTLFYFISKYVLGEHICIETGSDPIRTKFNEILAGKLLVCIEELENFSKAEWESISSTLKRMITSDKINYQNKCTKAFTSDNVNNYILCSNNDAIKDDDGRRYFILDIDNKHIGDHSYYNALYKAFNKESGKAFFNYVCSYDITDFNSQIFPVTQNKLDAYTKRLDPVYKFIKESYILVNEDMDIAFSELHNEYKKSNVLKHTQKEDFSKKLSDIGIKKSKVDGKYYFKYKHSELFDIATKLKWINELDEYNPLNIKDNEIDRLDI